METLAKILFAIIIVTLICLPAYGWIKNIVELTKLDFKAPYKAEVVRVLGVAAAPLGCILGFINIKDN